MTIRDAQREVRSVFLGGFPGQMVSATLWLLSAALSTWDSPRRGIELLVVGGMLIFPATQLLLRAMGRPASLSAENPLGQLAMQVAFTIPASLPLIGAATLHRLDWFSPAFMVVVGAHYLPFIFLYGMWQFAILATVLVGGGVAIGLARPDAFAIGGWLTGVVLLLFALAGPAIVARRERHIALG